MRLLRKCAGAWRLADSAVSNLTCNNLTCPENMTEPDRTLSEPLSQSLLEFQRFSLFFHLFAVIQGKKFAFSHHRAHRQFYLS